MEIPVIAVLDQNENYLCKMDNSAPGAIHFFNETFRAFLTGTAYALDGLTIIKNNTDVQFLKVGHKLAFKWKGKDYQFNITKVEEDEHVLTLDAVGLSLEIVNELAKPYTATGGLTFNQYLNIFDPEHTLAVGLNEVAERSLKLDWEGTDSRLTRILSLATKFDAEVEFLTELNSNYTVNQIIINIYKKHDGNYQGIGQDRPDIKLEYGKNVKTIRRTEDNSSVFTAIEPMGRDGAHIAYWEYEEYDDEGKLLFYSPKNDRYIYAPQMRDRYPSNTNKSTGRFIGYPWDYDTDNVELLGNQGVAELRRICEPELTYEIEGYFDLNIGDSVRVYDDGYDPPLILSARVSEQEISWTDPAQCKTTFTNVEVLQNEVDSSLLSKVQALIDANKKYDFSIVSDNGIVFKNNDGRTTLTARVADGATIVSDKFTIKWFKNNEVISNGDTLEIQASDVDAKAVYRFVAMDNDKEIGGYEVTVINVNDGESTGIPELTTEPEHPFPDMVYKNSNDGITYRWNGDEWEVYSFSGENVNVEKVSDLSKDIGKITSGNISGVNIESEFDRPIFEGAPVRKVGQISMFNGYFNSKYAIVEGETLLGRGEVNVSENGFSAVSYKAGGTFDQSFSLDEHGLVFNDGVNLGQLEAKYLIDYPWWNIALNSGYSWYGSPDPQYRPKVKLIFVGPNPFLLFFGIVTRSTGGGGGTWNYFGKVDLNAMAVTGYMTADANSVAAVGSGDGAQLGVRMDGQMVVRTPNNWTELRIGGLMPLT